MSLWESATQQPADAVFGVVAEYKKDPSPEKVNLVVGAYRDGAGKPYLLPSIAEAEKRVAAAELDKEYLPIDGMPEFNKAAVALALGADSPAIAEGRVMAMQTLSGTGALRLAGGLYKKLGVSGCVYVSDPTWANHRGIFTDAGFEVKTYRYWDAEKKGLNWEGYAADLEAMPEGSVVVLHMCAHNPTGVDPTEEQWREVARLCKARRHRVVFDSAYQGYCSGDLDADAFAARLFVKEGLEFAVTQSFSKNMGLYGERVGCFFQVCASADVATRMLSNGKQLARLYYSNPPKHGARLATMVMTEPALREMWVAELKGMSGRISSMRQALKDELVRLGTPGDWSHLVTQRGMFGYTGVSKAVVEHITSKFHVYMLPSGRVSIAGLTEGNVAHVAKAFHEAVLANQSNL